MGLAKKKMEIFGSVEAILGQSAEELQKKSGLHSTTAILCPIDFPSTAC